MEEASTTLDLFSGMMCFSILLLGGMAMFDWGFYLQEWIKRKIKRWFK